MNLKSVIYESLTPLQRIVATFDALGRGDDEEVQRLKETCAFKTYRQRDAAFSDTMESLLLMSLAVESDLTATALSYIATDRRDKSYLQDMANIQGGWLAVLEKFSINAEAMRGAGAPRHFVVEQLLLVAPRPEFEMIREFVGAFEGFMSS